VPPFDARSGARLPPTVGDHALVAHAFEPRLLTKPLPAKLNSHFNGRASWTASPHRDAVSTRRVSAVRGYSGTDRDGVRVDHPGLLVIGYIVALVVRVIGVHP